MPWKPTRRGDTISRNTGARRMRPRRGVRAAIAVVVVAGAFAARPSAAAFHLMQIEQAIGGVGGDTSAQAIELRLRFPGETFLGLARLRAWDAQGANPVTLVDFTSGVPNGRVGDRVLIASPSFANYTEAPIAADFELTNLIPESYLGAGRITFEGDDGTIYWLLSFGGPAYTGSTIGSSFNDRDGNFGPPFNAPLPSSDVRALLFQGTAVDFSLSNAVDYALTEGPAIFTNNAGDSVPIVPEPGTLGLLAVAAGMFIRRRAGPRRLATKCLDHQLTPSLAFRNR